jgi:hypothetical protein
MLWLKPAHPATHNKIAFAFSAAPKVEAVHLAHLNNL